MLNAFTSPEIMKFRIFKLCSMITPDPYNASVLTLFEVEDKDP